MTKARELSELGSYLNVSGGVASVNNITVSSNLEINVVVANGSVGTAGQMLTSNGSGVYWLSPQIGDITNVIAGTGLTGGGSSGEVTVSLATSGVVANTYGNSSSIPVITVDTYGRLTNVSTTAVAGVTNFTYTGANNTFSISTGDGSTFTANITAANSSLAGVVTVLDSVTNTSALIAASVNSVKTAYDAAIAANTRAASAQTAAISAYSNATSYADSAAATAYSNAVSVASADATNKAANAYSNAVSYAATIAGTAYSNAVATAAGDATLKANNAYTTAVSTAASDATNKAANAYLNAVSYAATIAGTAYSNAVSTAAADATSKANNAYTTAVAAAASDATSKANNAYTTAVAAAASDATSKANNAYTTAVSAASTDATNKAANAYSNATTFASNASNISTGTLAEPRLPYRMNQDVRTTDSVTFANGSFTGTVSVGGDLIITGNVESANVQSLAVSDPLIKLGVNNPADTSWGGFTFHYSGSGNTTNHAGLVRNPSTKEFLLMSTYGDEVNVANNNSINVADPSFSYANLQLNALTAQNATVSGNVGIGTTSPASKLHIQGSAPELRLYSDTTTGSTINFIDQIWQSQIVGSGGSIAFNAGGTTERMRIDSGGNVGIGTTNPTSLLEMYSSSVARLAVVSDLNATISIGRFVTSAAGPSLQFAKYRGSYASHAAVASGDVLSSIVSFGYGGTNVRQLAAITSAVDTFTSDSNISSYISFATSTAGSASSTEKMRINSSGTVSATGDFRAPIFYDSDNTAYYTNPAATSTLSSMLIGYNESTLAYNAAATGKLYFGSFQGDASDYYHITTNMENVGGNYSKLDFKWYTGMRFYAYSGYGGFRFKDYLSGNTLFSVGEGDAHVRITNNLYVPVVYDKDNTAFYLDPASGSNLNGTLINNGGTTMSGGWNRSLLLNASFPVVVFNSNDTKYSGIGVDYSEAQSGMVFWVNGSSSNITDGSSTIAMRINTSNFVTALGSFRAPIFYDSIDSGYYVDPNSTSKFATVEAIGGSGLRSFAGSSSSISSQIYFGNADNTRAWNWQVDENNRGALWSYDGSGWSKSLTIAHRGGGVFLRNNAGADVLAFSTSYYGYSSSYRTLVIGDQAYTTVCIGVDPIGNLSGSFNGGGSGVEVMFKNGVNFITPNSSNNGYHTPLTLADGYAAATGSFRAPVFYDSNNTGYYIDPNNSGNWSITTAGNASFSAGTMVLRSNGIEQWSTNGEAEIAINFYGYAGGTTQGRNFRVFDGKTSVRFAVYGDSNYSAATGSMRAPLFYDTDNTGYYFDGAGTSVMSDAVIGGRTMSTAMFYAGFTLDANTMPSNSTGFTYSVNAPYTGPIMRVSAGGGYDMWFNAPYSGGGGGLSFRTRNGDSSSLNSWFSLAVYNSTRSIGDLYATAYYDGNDSSYYLNPNSDSVLYRTSTYLSPKDNNSNWNTAFQNTPPFSKAFHGDYSGGGPAGSWWFYESMRHSNASNYWGTQIAWGWEDNANRLFQRNVSGGAFSGWVEYLNTSNRTYDGNLNMTGSIISTSCDMRAPIFYDQNNTAYYLDPASTSSGNLAGYLYFANHGGGIVGNYSSYRYQLVYGMGDSYKGSLDGTSVAGGYGLWYSHPNAGGVATNLDTHGLMNIVNGEWHASLANSTRANGDMRAPIFYDLNDTGYYVNPNSTSNVVYLQASRVAAGYDAGVANSISCSEWFRSSGNTGWYNASYFGGIYMEDGTWVRVYNSKAFYVANEIAATGNITAYYSDERLKTKTGTISNAINKVKSLEGFTYVENELAKSLGYTNNKQQVGISAQQVQAVLPEAVSLAPVDFETLEDGTIVSKSGENYLTVDYSRLVPLLIEAIKEQQLTITEQSAKINTLEAKLDQIIQKLEG